jgi:hypothetical protein
MALTRFGSNCPSEVKHYILMDPKKVKAIPFCRFMSKKVNSRSYRFILQFSEYIKDAKILSQEDKEYLEFKLFQLLKCYGWHLLYCMLHGSIILFNYVHAKWCKFGSSDLAKNVIGHFNVFSETILIHKRCFWLALLQFLTYNCNSMYILITYKKRIKNQSCEDCCITRCFPL